MKKSSLKNKEIKKLSKKLDFKENQKNSSNDDNYKRNSEFKRQKTNRKKTINKNETNSPEFPEAIVDAILNKILSYVIHQTEIKKVYKHLDKKCFEYLKYLIDPYLSTEYIYYEDGIEDINFNKKNCSIKRLYLKKLIHGYL